MNYDLRFKPRSVKDLKKLPAELRRRIIEEMTEDLAGDVKQLTNFTPEYRLRVGDYRVLFEIEGNTFGIAGKRIDEREATNDWASPTNYREGREEGVRCTPL